ncbi:Mu transposase C-terminal domain-containing protein [Stenomitos frigidus]|uniref:Transposase n=1 Tax=Stenomitos frigidus ULC18 TaxID=2107698 RepID=A0A2T1ENS3_9CYAN|nr:Mu transposase C-terminal domain-containing protein [Stenomitos frigidus]PSB34400.1 transposase [Stenomitos frigidus ULC18]
MKLFVNMLIEWQGSTEPYIERVLWIDSSGTDVATIDIINPNALPVFRKSSEIEAAIASGDSQVLEVDPYAVFLRAENDIQEKHRQKRDAAWEVIAPLVEDPTGQIFYSHGRGALLNAHEEKTGWTKKTIYKFLRRYWQGGQTKNALLPLYDKCGGKGKERQSSTGRKRGRPSRLTKVTSLPTGINVDAAVREKFSRGIRLFYETAEQRTLQDAYQKTLEKFFHKGYDKLPDGTLVPFLPPAEELPSFGQFRYWYEKERNVTQALSTREGKRRYNLRHREVLGDSTQMAFGPGSVYQIDATIGDIYLVSSLDRTRIIGRPVIYVVIDVFTRLIVGMSVLLEGPSWVGAMQAVENAASDKVSFCREYGVEITEEDWPCYHLPEMILADRGEFEGYNADNLVNALNIRISNTPPYRADWKAIVERNFRLSNDKFIHWAPGAVYKPRQRGDADYRLDAVLDLHQFRKLMILSILDHNKDHRMDWYRMDEFMIREHIDPYPIDLWNWGIRNRVGHLRTVTPEILRLNLLPGEKATVTYRGIRCFQGLLYSCDLALREQWFVRARERGSWKINIAYDPRRLDEIYLRLDGGRSLECCQLIDADKTFRGKDWYEAADYLEVRQQEKERAKSRKQQSKAALNAQMEQIISEATEQTSRDLESAGQQSKRSRIQGIRQNRKEASEVDREDQAWRLGKPEPTGESAKVVPLIMPTNENQETDSEEELDEPVGVPESEIADDETATDSTHVARSQLIDKLRKLKNKKGVDDE